MIENEITLIIGGEMKGTVGTSWSAHMGQHLGSRGVTSRRSARRICSLEPVLGGSFCLLVSFICVNKYSLYYSNFNMNSRKLILMNLF